ncbi:hypothetical protein Tco_0487681 [Tanacetum coccineum]
MKNWRLEAIKKNLERITRQQKWDQQINELMKAIEALPVWVGHTKEFGEQNIRLNQKRDVEACEYLNSHPQVVNDGCNDRSCVKENVALTHFDEEFVQEDPKELSYAQEKVKEYVALGAGLVAVEKKLEKDGTYSSREQGEADWQLASETDLQDFHYTIFEHKWAGIQGLGRLAKGMSEGLQYGIKHGKAGRDLGDVEAYDPEANDKFVKALQDLKYPIVDQLERLKDSPIDLIMASLHLENPWAVKEEISLEDAIAANISRAKKKKKCRVVCRTHGVGSAHHARSDGVAVSVSTAAHQGLAILLTDAATQTEGSEGGVSPRLIRSKSLPLGT